ncbi:DUF2268 domain-containing protein, partial [SCandidatus Aminicenantes bacterium Aminicenantia_JdfR_composite]|nr:DUF2268 domain-containing protein [SCandidatus Aminicenantes bacterium Aminicenantia_JdfR_composite]
YLININREKISFGEKIKELLISEGIGTYFSFTVFPDYRIYELFLFTKDLYYWCLKNENYLRNIYCSGKFSFEELIKFYTIGNIDLNLPPRAGKYLGFKAVKNFLEKNKKSIKNLFHNPSLI